MKTTLLVIALVMSAVLFACGTKSNQAVATGKTIKSVPVGNLTATLSSESGTLNHGNQEVMLSFTDSAGKPVDVGAASLNFHMPQMGTMQEMNDATSLTTTTTPGVYRGKVNIEVPGEWQAQVAYDGPAGKGKATFSVNAH
jgi:nitrogen fixation protein FixH